MKIKTEKAWQKAAKVILVGIGILAVIAALGYIVLIASSSGSCSAKYIRHADGAVTEEACVE